MPRDGSGNYTLPSSNPVVDGTIIDVNWANPTLSDIAAQLNNVYTRDGVLGPTGPFKILDGTVASPGLAWASEPSMGWYRAAAGFTGYAVGGTLVHTLDARGTGNTQMNMWPRSDGSSRITLFTNSTASSDVSNMTMYVTGAGGVISAIGSTGSNFKALTFNAQSYTWFSNAGAYSANFDTGRFIAPAVGIGTNTIWLQDGAYVIQSSDATRGWFFTKASGNMAWTVSGTATHTLFPNGDFAATGFVSGSSVGLSAAVRWLQDATYIIQSYDSQRAWYYTKSTAVMSWASAGVATHSFLTNGDLRINGTLTAAGIAGGVTLSATGLVLPATSFPGGLQKVVQGFPSSMEAYLSFYHSGSVGHIDLANAGQVFRFTTGGDAQKQLGPNTWTITSDRRVKHDIVDYMPGLAEILQIRPRRYKYNARPEQEFVGIIADEMKPILPGTIRENEEGLDTFNSDEVTWALVNSVKELHGRLDRLEVHS